MNSTHTTLGLAVPTNEPDVAFRYLLKDLHHLKALSKFATFLFNFQKPWTSEQIDEAINICKSQGFDVRYSFNSYEVKGKGLVPFNQIRGDACRLMPEARFFMLMDDDFSFLGASSSHHQDAGTQLLCVLHYLLTFEDCGFILLKNDYCYKEQIPRYVVSPTPTMDNRYITDKGIILRNFDANQGWVVPHDAIELLGSDEEKIACAWRLFNGMYPAAINHTRIRHYENSNSTTTDNPPVSGEEMYQWNAKDILEANANRYIRENFYPDFINRGWRVTQLIDPEIYSKAGGHELSDDFRDTRSIDYHCMDADSLEASITRLLV